MGNSLIDVVMPFDEVRVLDALNGLNANTIKKRDCIPWPDIKEGGNNKANVRTNLYSAVHPANFGQAFDGCLQGFAMGFKKKTRTCFWQFAQPDNTH
jgi:hypothetical protein